MNVYAPISGVIVAQNVTNAAAAGVTYSGTSTAFTIADLSVVWIVCDVYENDLPKVHLGQEAQIQLDAYPGKVLTGRISDIGPVLDPTIRTAKVRLEVSNPGILKLGMFVTATFLGHTKEATPSCRPPPSCTFTIANGCLCRRRKQFKRMEVTAGNMLPGNQQEILSGIAPASSWCETCCNWKQRWRRNDPEAGRLCAAEPLPGSGDRVLLFGWGAFRFIACRSRHIPTLRTTTSTSSHSGPASPPNKSSSRSRFRSKP